MVTNFKKNKVKFVAPWQDSQSITKLLINQFKTSEIDLSNIEFVYDDSYDIIVYNNYITEEPKKDSKSYIFFHEPSWNGSHQKDFFKYNDLIVYGFSENLYNAKNIIELPSHMFYGGRGTWCEGWNFWTFNSLNKEFNKTKKISSIVSKLGEKNESIPKGCLYRERFNLIKNLISKFNNIDFYGWGKNNSNLKGDLIEKKDALEQYKFSICIENSNEKNYISEKFYDCILTDTIPIYYGCKNIKEIWPEKGYILLEDITNLESVSKTIKNIEQNTDSIYHEMLPELRKIKKRYFEENNLLKLINNL